MGCCMTRPSAAQQACPARQVCGLTRDCTLQFVRRLTTKELAFQRFVTPRNVRVNDKNKRAGGQKAKEEIPWPCLAASTAYSRTHGPFFSMNRKPYRVEGVTEDSERTARAFPTYCSPGSMR